MEPLKQTVVQHRKGTRIDLKIVEPNRETNDHMKIFTVASEHLAKSKKLTLTDIRVFFAMVSLADYGNELCISQAELGKYIDVVQPEVNKAILRLGDMNYLTVIDHRGNKNVYMLNPEMVYKGAGGKERQAAIDKFNNPVNIPKVIGKKLASAVFPIHKASGADLIY